MIKKLSVYKIRNKLYYRDIRLGEYRNIDNPNDTIDINISNEQLQKPTQKDVDKLWKSELRK